MKKVSLILAIIALLFATSCKKNNSVDDNSSKNECFYFEAVEPGAVIGMIKNERGEFEVGLEYSTDKSSWQSFVVSQTSVTLAIAGDRVYIRAKDKNTSIDKTFTATKKVKVGGNIMYLLDGTGATTDFDPATNGYAFNYLFDGMTTLTDASALSLPAMTLSEYCYHRMFNGDSLLTAAPKLPATTLAYCCYQSMFFDCVSLTESPELPATKMATTCYSEMFYGDTSLTTAPALPAKELAVNCYRDMFFGCSSLKEAPVLPAKELADNCYEGMFNCCISLAAAPALPATTLKNNCYRSMFYGCSSIKAAPALPATKLVSGCYKSMFSSCRSLQSIDVSFTEWDDAEEATDNWSYNLANEGTFTCPAALDTTIRDNSHIVYQWTIKTK